MRREGEDDEPLASRPQREAEVTRRLKAVLETYGPPPGSEFPCPYLPGQMARHVTIAPAPLVPGIYHSLMDLNFRRAGPVFYRPGCDACASCQALRVPVAAFKPSRAQRRTAARDADLDVRMGPPRPTEEKRQLFARYLEARHAEGEMSADAETFEGFLYASPLASLEAEYRLGDRLVAAAIVDIEPNCLSAVYCYFDPGEARRALGVFNVLTLVEECRRRRVDYLYLGYWIAGARTMAYKDQYRPCEILRKDGSWERRD
jgi:leucyl-tRNA---protein transferase